MNQRGFKCEGAQKMTQVKLENRISLQQETGNCILKWLNDLTWLKEKTFSYTRGNRPKTQRVWHFNPENAMQNGTWVYLWLLPSVSLSPLLHSLSSLTAIGKRSAKGVRERGKTLKTKQFQWYLNRFKLPFLEAFKVKLSFWESIEGDKVLKVMLLGNDLTFSKTVELLHFSQRATLCHKPESSSPNSPALILFWNRFA